MIDLSGRKCPKHNQWVKTHKSSGLRYCTNCDVERIAKEKAEPVKALPFYLQQSKPRIGKL